MDKRIKYFSAFSGIGGFELAMPKDWECVGFSEIDKYAIQVYSKHFPSHKNFGDIIQINIEALPDFDLLVGGSPCQDLSVAKKNREGLDGSRSCLFYKFVEILEKKKPKYFILENVNSMPQESKDKISEILGVQSIMINASLVSAQNRKRLFWANFAITQPKDKGILLKDILEENVDEKFYSSGQAMRNNYRVLRNLRSVNGKSKSLTATMWKGDGNNGMTTIRVGQIGKGGQGDRIYSVEGKSVNLSANGGGRGAKTGLYAVSIRGRNIVDGKRKDILGAKTEQRLEIGKPDKAHTITSVFKDSMIMEDCIVRKLTPIECERLQCFPDNFTEGISNTRRYQTLGNAVNVEVVKHIMKAIP